MTPAEAAQILQDACPVHSLSVTSGSLATLRPSERIPWEAMATALLEHIEAELQSQEPCPRCGCGISAHSQPETVGGPIRPQTLRERLEVQRRYLRDRLNELDMAAEALDAHPDLERLFTLVSRV